MVSLGAGTDRFTPGERAGGRLTQSLQRVCVKAVQLASGGQNLGGGACPQAEKPQKQVLGVHLSEAGAQTFRRRQLHRLPAVGRQALEGEAHRAARTGDLTNPCFQTLGSEAGGPEDSGGHTLTLLAESQQQVLRSHIAVSQPHRGLLRQL